MTRDLAHWDVIEALEEVCVYKVFEVYGVTDHHDKHRLKVKGNVYVYGRLGVLNNILFDIVKLEKEVDNKLWLTLITIFRAPVLTPASAQGA